MNAFDDKFYELLGKIPHQQLADRYNTTIGRVRYQYAKQRLASEYEPPRRRDDFDDSFFDRLFYVPAKQLAQEYGVSLNSVYHQKRKLLNQTPQKRRVYPPEFYAELHTLKAHELAAKYNTTYGSVTYQRWISGKKIRKAPNAQEIEQILGEHFTWLGTKSDFAVSKATGVPTARIARFRKTLGVPAYNRHAPIPRTRLIQLELPLG